MHTELSGQPCLTSHIQEEVSKSALPNITHTARKHGRMFSCWWHWQLLSMAESAVNPAMPLPLTSYHLPHPVLPKPKKGSTHQQLRRPPPSPPRHHHCRIPGNERADELVMEAVSLPQEAPRMRTLCKPGPWPGPPPGPGAGLGRTPYS